MIKRLMTVSIRDRYTVDDALNDPWLSEVCTQFDSGEARGYVSLREIDLFFDKRVPDLEITEDLLVRTSCSGFDLRKVSHMLGKKHKKKKHHHHHHKDDGESHKRRKKRKSK